MRVQVFDGHAEPVLEHTAAIVTVVTVDSGVVLVNFTDGRTTRHDTLEPGSWDAVVITP